jgi:hypothetical protein
MLGSDADLRAAPSFAGAQLSDERLAALLRGVVPCFDPQLARSYGEGVRLSSRVASDAAPQEELKVEELVALLARPGVGRSLSLHTIRHIQDMSEKDGGASEVYIAFVSAGFLPAVFYAAAEATQQLAGKTLSEGALAEVALSASVIDAAVNRGGALLKDSSLGVSSEQHLRWLFMAGRCLMRSAVADAGSGTATVAKDAAAQLLHAFYTFRKRTDALWSLSAVCLAEDTLDRPFIQACCFAMKKFPGTQFASAAIRALFVGANNARFCDMMCEPEVAGFECVLEGISSTAHSSEALEWLLSTITNAATASPHYGVKFAEKGAFGAIQPALFCPDSTVVIAAAMVVGLLATIPDAAELLSRSDVLEVCQTVLRAMSPGEATDDSTKLDPDDVKVMTAMIGADTPAPVKLIALHNLCTFASALNARVLQAAATIAAVRACAGPLMSEDDRHPRLSRFVRALSGVVSGHR